MSPLRAAGPAGALVLAACGAPEPGPAPDAQERARFAAACAEGPGYAPAICDCLSERAAERFDETRFRLIRISLTGAAIRPAAERAGLNRDQIGQISRFVMENLAHCADGEPDAPLPFQPAPET
ncbi:hypothetical protein FKB34_02940 [Glycocaulis profundi]|nr:hypothetical protein FKB34_02940 [Glycocaulis profundi]